MKTRLFCAAAILAAAAAPALASEGDRPRQKVVIMTERIGGEGQKDGQAGREPRHRTTIVTDCGADRTDFSGSAEGGKDKTRILICSRGNASSAERARRLEHVLERINANDELSAESKARIATALREAIARLDAAH